MTDAHRYIAFAIIDFLLCGLIAYRFIAPWALGNAPFSWLVVIGVVVSGASLAMGIRFVLIAKNRWGKSRG